MNLKNAYVKTMFLFAIGMFCFLAIGGVFFHNHEDAYNHDDCQICQWAISCAFTFLIVTLLFFCLLFCRKAPVFVSVFISIFCKISLHLRSPPAILSIV